jgi:hypothetical protein
VVLRAERTIECYDTRQPCGADKAAAAGADKDSGGHGQRDYDSWSALKTVRTVLMLRGLARYWKKPSSSSSAWGAEAAAAACGEEDPTSDMTDEDEDLDHRSVQGPWKLRMMPCA